MLKDSVICGLIVALVGVVLHHVSLSVVGPHDLNDFKVFAGHLFIIGVVTYILKEVVLKDLINKF